MASGAVLAHRVRPCVTYGSLHFDGSRLRAHGGNAPNCLILVKNIQVSKRWQTANFPLIGPHGGRLVAPILQWKPHREVPYARENAFMRRNSARKQTAGPARRDNLRFIHHVAANAFPASQSPTAAAKAMTAKWLAFLAATNGIELGPGVRLRRKVGHTRRECDGNCICERKRVIRKVILSWRLSPLDQKQYRDHSVDSPPSAAINSASNSAVVELKCKCRLLH